MITDNNNYYDYSIYDYSWITSELRSLTPRLVYAQRHSHPVITYAKRGVNVPGPSYSVSDIYAFPHADPATHCSHH